MDDKTLKDHELWSLCYECLISLQLGKDYPAYLCLESVYIDCSGKVLFVATPSKETFDSFYLAPEFEKQSVVTEKVCVYGVAAILWTAAKFNAPANEKLSLSRSLKKLLLSMAKRNSAERPSVKEALKICNDYLVHRGIASRKILTLLRNSILQNQHKEDASVSGMEFQTEEIEPSHSPLGNIDCTQESPRLGFVPLAGDSKLTAVKGPIPCQYSVNSKSPSKLPEAFTSPATHFKPIILTQHKEKTSTKMPTNTPTAKQLVKAMKHEIQKNKGMVSVKDIENDIVMEKSTMDFGTESIENNTNRSICLVSSGQTISPCNVSHTTEGKTDNISKTLSQAQKTNSSFCCSAVSTFPANNSILHQTSKSEMRTLAPIQSVMPEQDVPSDDKMKNCFREPAVLLNTESDRHSGDSLKFVTSPLQDTSTHMIGSNEDLKAKIKKFPGSEPSNDDFNGSVDTEDVASNSPLSNKCLFTQETLRTGIQAKTFTPIPHLTEISEDVHLSSSHILSCSLDAHMAIKSSSSNSICLLQKIVHLIQEEFAFDGYLENGEEAQAMGEYILSLNRLKFGTFTNAISEKFCDLYWDEKLLEQLYEVVNGDSPPLSRLTVRSNTGSGLTLPKMNKKNRKSPIHGTERSKDIREKNLLVSEEKIADIDETLSDNLYSDEEDQLHSNTEVIPGHDVNSIIPDAMDSKETASDISKEEGTLFLIENTLHVETCTISENLKERCNEEKEETEGHTTEVPEARLSVALWPTLSNMERKSCNPGWSSAFFGMECFNQDVKTYVKQLGQHSSSETQNIEAKMLELNQQLMMETKDFRKTKTFYQKLQQQERRSKGTDTKIVLPKLKEQLEEVKLKVEFLELAKKYLEVLHMEQWGLNSSVLPSLVSSSSQTDMLELKSTDINSLLTFHSLKDDQSHSNIRLQMLQAGTTMGLMAYLYNSNAVIEGYIQQFFYTFRYFTSPSDLFQFLTDRFDSAAHISLNQKRSTDCIKVLNRTLDLLQGWVEECYNVDFAQDIELVHKLEIFISTKVIPYDDRGQHLANLLHTCSKAKMVHKLSHLSFSAEDMKIEEDIQSLHSFSKKLSEENISRKSFKWKISKGSESTSPQHKERYYTIAAALPRPCYSSFAAELSGSCQKLDEKGLSMLTEYSPQHTAQQLTLLQQELFQDCHPVNFLNSRAFGVKDKSPAVTKSVSPEPVVIEGNSLFVPEYRQEHYLIQLIKYADNVGNWVSAEIVNCDTSKTQNGLITKCLLMAKCCYEWRNFATAMQILSGLENLIVRQLPAWKNLSSKALEIMEELTAVQVFLKSDSLCLMEGDSFRKQPTIPCACILAMHVQQVEIGSFTMANGTYKWPKLRKIAKVVSQIRAFQENPYVFTPDSEMQMYLRHRISHFSEVDIHVLAAENKTNFYQSSNELHSRKIQDTLRKVKATFQ
uniref:Protein very KIND n=2 Tax=Callorhinchus milii TaxID=7868 RepID=A0A4W3JX37_CALMI